MQDRRWLSMIALVKTQESPLAPLWYAGVNGRSLAAKQPGLSMGVSVVPSRVSSGCMSWGISGHGSTYPRPHELLAINSPKAEETLRFVPERM